MKKKIFLLSVFVLTTMLSLNIASAELSEETEQRVRSAAAGAAVDRCGLNPFYEGFSVEVLSNHRGVIYWWNRVLPHQQGQIGFSYSIREGEEVYISSVSCG